MIHYESHEKQNMKEKPTEKIQKAAKIWEEK